MKKNNIHIIMPVKDSLETAERAIRAIVDSGHTLTVYNDNSTAENTQRLHALAEQLAFTLIDIAAITAHPSPNYLYVLKDARSHALAERSALIIVESDVIVSGDTINRLASDYLPSADSLSPSAPIGLVAAVTHDTEGQINFPYDYARSWKQTGSVVTKKRFSFCCTMLTTELLEALDFEQELDPEKNWYDVTISHRSIELGFTNILMLDNPVLHLPHSSRPWKQLKYTNPLLYYWRKLTQRKDRI